MDMEYDPTTNNSTAEVAIKENKVQPLRSGFRTSSGFRSSNDDEFYSLTHLGNQGPDLTICHS